MEYQPQSHEDLLRMAVSAERSLTLEYARNPGIEIVELCEWAKRYALHHNLNLNISLDGTTIYIEDASETDKGDNHEIPNQP